MRNRYDPTLGNFDDAMPDGGPRRAAMGAPVGGASYHAEARVKGWRMGRAEYSEWVVYDQALLDKLVGWIPWLSFSAPNGAPFNPGNAYTPFFKFQYDAFIASGGNFDAFIETIGRFPSNDNLPTWMFNYQWAADRRAHVAFPYPNGRSGDENVYGGMSRAVAWGIFATVNKPPPNGAFQTGQPFQFMGSLPLLAEVGYY